MAMSRSAFGISFTLASRVFSPSALRASALSSAARSLIAARSSAENVWDFFLAAFFSAIGQLLDADEVARRVAKGAVADPVRLVDRLLDDLGVAGLQSREGAVEVGGGQVDAGEGPLGHHLGDRGALVVGDAGAGLRRVQDDGRPGLVGWADRDPVHPAVLDVTADFEAQRVA